MTMSLFDSVVPADMATKLSFTQSMSTIAENDSTGVVTLDVSRTGAGRTCTYVGKTQQRYLFEGKRSGVEWGPEGSPSLQEYKTNE